MAPPPPSSSFGRPLIIVGVILLLHSAYSTYEHSSISKAVGVEPIVPLDITIETIASFLLLLLGVTMSAQPLKEITWAAEIKKKSLDEIDARTNFATFSHRGQVLFAAAEGGR